MNERAASEDSVLRPIWHMDAGKALFAGPLHHNRGHAHSVPVYLAGLYGRFRLRVGHGDWHSCRNAVVPAGITYEFDMEGAPLAVFYLEPGTAHAKALAPLVRGGFEENGALLGLAGEVGPLREIFEDRTGPDWAEGALDELLRFSFRRAPVSTDARIWRVLQQLYGSYRDLAPVAQVAAEIGLSGSRFQHLFTESVGVPFRRFRGWCRMRVAIQEILDGSNFTAAAHAAGFADQPHFAREFRRTFGAPASPSLASVRPRTKRPAR
ncbi:MAG: helix-turn-helix domain-containing protein [Geminicoccaceae bacterium]